MAKAKFSTWISITILMALMSRILPSRAAECTFSTLRHVGYFHDLDHEGDLYVSWAGGAILQFSGSGFNGVPIANTVYFETTALTSSGEISIQGTLMNDQDEFRSEPNHAGKISYTLPSFNDLMAPYGLGKDWFNSHHEVWMDLFIKTGNGEESICCSADNKCRIKPNWGYTPISYGVTPNVLWEGKKTTMMLYTGGAPSLQFKGSFIHMIDIRFDDHELDRNSLTDEEVTTQQNLRNWRTEYVEGYITTNVRAASPRVVAWFHGAGYAYKDELASITCNIDATKCYDAMIMPVIEKINHSGGYTSGGQEVIITGKSLNATVADVKIADTACTVTSSTFYEIKCTTGSKVLGVDPALFPGQHGLRRKHWTDNSVTSANFGDYTVSFEELLTSFEIPYTGDHHRTFDRITGFFEAPVDGQYQFHQACDDACQFYMSLTDPLDPSTKELLMDRHGGNNGDYTFRNYHEHTYTSDPDATTNHVGIVFSEWKQLQKGQLYYIESYLVQGGGTAHLTVGVEIKPDVEGDVASDHPQQTPQYQHLKVTQDITREVSRLTVNNPDGKEFVFIFTDPFNNTADDIITDPAIAGCTANELRDIIKGFYQYSVKTDPVVTLTCYDSDDIEIDNCNTITTYSCTNPDDETTVTCESCQDADGAGIGCDNTAAAKCVDSLSAAVACSPINKNDFVPTHVYDITVPRSISRDSWTDCEVVGTKTSATLKFDSPEDLDQHSNLPLNGTYFLQCDENGELRNTHSLPYNADENYVKSRIIDMCPSLRNKFQVLRSGDYYYQEDGLNWLLWFESFNSNLQPFAIMNNTDDISQNGNDQPIMGVNAVIENSVLNERGRGTKNVYYKFIPFEMLYTDEATAQVLVKVDDMPAVCVNLNCGYTYEQSSAEVSTMNVNALAVDIAGTNLPTDVQSISIGHANCAVTANDGTSISCTLDYPAMAGSWTPQIKDLKGLFPMATTFTMYSVDLVVTAVLPNDDLCPAGGDELVITGSGYPSVTTLGGDVITIKFDDNTLCDLIGSTPTEMRCVTRRFDPAFTASRRELTFGTFARKLTVMATDLVQEVAVTLNSDPLKVDSITPSSASPILWSTLEIQLGLTYDNSDMANDAFTVNLLPQAGGKIRPLKVVSIDAPNRKLTVKYGGAYSGVYDLEVKSDANGPLTTDDVTFEAKIEVTDFQPKSGSKFGGTKVTISGGHFSDNKLDNPVKIDYKWVGGVNHYCYVLTTSDSEITCRMATDYKRTKGDSEVIVFASTFEEAKFADGLDKMFTFVDTDALPTLTGFSVNFNAQHEYVITIAGTGITDTGIENVNVFLDGVEQETLNTVSPTQVEIKLIGINKGSKKNTFEVYLSEGVPNGWHDDVNPTMFDAGIQFDPKLINLSEHTGNAAGGVIYAEIVGAGMSDPYTLVDSDDFDICEEAKMIAYSLLECKMKAKMYSTATTMGVKNKDTGATYSCGNDADVTQCQYTSEGTGTTPTYTSVALDTATKSTLTFAGVLLNKYGLNQICDVEVLGIKATSCQVNSETEVVATFAGGFPVTAAEVVPVLRVFDHCNASMATLCTAQEPDVTNWYVIAPPTDYTGLTNDLDVTDDAGQTLSCGFGGGCRRIINAKGLKTSVENNRAQIEVCGLPCSIDKDASSAAAVHCEVPAIQSLESIKTFTIEKPGPILGNRNMVSSTELEQIVFDNNNFPSIDNTGSNCYIGTRFAGDASSYFVGVLSEVKIFMDYFSNKDVYNGKMKLEGSNVGFSDPAQITTIFTVGDELHEGWNYYDFKDMFGDNYVFPKFRYYRLFNAQNNGCDKIGEVKFIGTKAFDVENQNTHECQVTIESDKQDFTEVNLFDNGGAKVNYAIDTTPYVTSIVPRYGSVEGGKTVTFNGGNFPTGNTGLYTILIDDIPCSIDDVQETSISCTTGPRTGAFELDPKLSIYVEGEGYAVTQGHLYRYVSLWSSASTWGGLFAPIDGESVAVPKGTNLLVDIKKSPKLNLVIVDGGSLIFPSNSTDHTYHQTFDAHYIFLNDGALMEVGTEEEPYQSKLNITMHGERYGAYIPKFGNKCIGVTYSTLEIHGVPRTPTWTSLQSTAQKDETSITVMEDVDWKVGEKIVIASTDLGIEDNEIAGEGDRSEVREITNVNGRQIFFAEKLKYEHYAAVDQFGTEGDEIEMRAEVGLLTRNILFQGDPDTSLMNQYGATIMLHSPGDESVVGRVEYMEFFNVGQAFQLGRYPIHYHMIGQVTQSYVRGNSIHQSFNRGTTIHGVHYLRVEKNVYYHCKGHNVFIEDGAETRNYVAYNLVLQSRASHSILNTDTTPASFWITNPDNIWVGNHAAGGARYGFWFDLQVNSIGPSASKNICPISFKLGEFRDNVAHSMGRYGLRIFHEHTPRKHPCSPVTFNQTAHDLGLDPYTANPVIPAYYENFIAYKNGRNGVIAEDIGAVRFVNIKTVDNILGGIEVNRIFDVRDDDFGGAYIDGAIVVGRSQKSVDHPTTFQGTAQDSGFSATGLSPHGVITPQDDFFKVKNVRFYNFNFNEAAPIGTCSHCFKPPATDSDGRTVMFEKTYIEEATVNNKIRYQFPFKTIIQDTDGTLTGKGANSWAIAGHWNHNLWANECEEDPIFNGYTCVNSVTIRRVMIYNFAPGNLHNMDICVLQYDKDTTLKGKDAEAIKTYEAAGENNSLCSIIEFRGKTRPANHWTAPFVTGHTYYLRWEYGLDFEKMRFEIIEPLWNSTFDKDIIFEMPFYDVRSEIRVQPNIGDRVDNNTLTLTRDWNKFGANFVQNETFEDIATVPTQEKRLRLAISAATTNNVYATDGVTRLDLVGIRPEKVTVVEEGELGDIQYWSNLTTWEGKFKHGGIPIEGDMVIISSTMNVVLDVPAADMPKLRSVEINGQLTFQTGADRMIRSHQIWVRGGILNIGSKTNPFDKKATIELLGDNTQYYWSFVSSVEAGNKNLVVTGTVNMYGQAPDNYTSRMFKPAYKGDSKITVEPLLTWKTGDTIGIAATNMRTMDYDECKILSYDKGSGKIECEKRLNGYHFGASASTEDDYGVDMRAEVWLMDRNVKIQASTDDIGFILQEPWGCQVLVSDFREPTLVQRTGSLNFDNVQVYNCSQKMTYKGALRWEGATKSKEGSSVTNSVISSGRGMGIVIEGSAKVELIGNVIADHVQQGIWVKQSQQITIEDNWVHHIISELKDPPKVREYPILQPFAIGGITATQGTSRIKIKNNIVSGTWHHAFHFKPERCDRKTHQVLADDDPDFIFEGNIAHSISGYGAIALNVDNDCTIVHDFLAYKCTETSIMLGGPSKLNVGRKLVSIDNRYGIGLHSGGGGDAHLYDSQAYGENEDNEDCPEGSECDHCFDTTGVVLNQACGGAHDDHKTKWFKLPLFKKCTSSMTGQAYYHKVEFINWKGSTKKCGAKQKAIGPWPGNSDYVAYGEFLNPTFNNVHDDAIVFYYPPSQGWINWEDCGIEFTCTGLYNIVIRFEDVFLKGNTRPNFGGKNTFDITSNNAESISVDTFKDRRCTFKKTWNAWLCDDEFAVLIFDSLDEDRMDRSAQPIYIYGYELAANGTELEVCNLDKQCFKNRLNAFMDHCWDGFYTCQKREQRFPTMIWQPADTYWIEYTGTPPKNQKFVFHANDGAGFKVRIKYSDAGAYAVYKDDGTVIAPTAWDANTNNWADLPRECGQNRYEGVKNILEFYITSKDCGLTIRPRDAIMLGVRLEFTMDEFFASGGVVSFVDRMAASLGIHKADIRVVSVYEGSTIIDFQIISDLLSDTPLDLDVVKETFEVVVSTMDTFMGSPVLNAVSTGTPIITPNTVLNPEGGITGGDAFFNFGLDDEVEKVEKEPEIEVQVRYREKIAIQAENKANASGYILILVCIILILALIIVALALYRRIAVNSCKVDKNQIPEAVKTAPEFESMNELDKQYDPKKDFEGSGFGGIRFDRQSTRKKEKMGDNLAVMTINSNIHQLSSPNRGQDTDRKLNDEEADVCAGTPSQWQEAESAEQQLDGQPKKKSSKNKLNKR